MGLAEHQLDAVIVTASSVSIFSLLAQTIFLVEKTWIILPPFLGLEPAPSFVGLWNISQETFVSTRHALDISNRRE